MIRITARLLLALYNIVKIICIITDRLLYTICRSLCSSNGVIFMIGTLFNTAINILFLLFTNDKASNSNSFVYVMKCLWHCPVTRTLFIVVEICIIMSIMKEAGTFKKIERALKDAAE